MTLLQTGCLFVTGYLVSRLVLRAGATEVFVHWLLRASGGRVSRVVLWLMLLAFGLSTVLPNALTVLALLPVITRLQRGAEANAATTDQGPLISTLLAMGLIYGANIGGVGSLLGSPANLYLLVNLAVYDVAGRGQLHFLSWLTFGLPMALSLLLLCWGVIWLTSPRTMALRLQPEDTDRVRPGPRLKAARRAALLWVVGWAALITAGLALAHGRPPGENASPVLLSFTLAGHALRLEVLDAVAAGFTLTFAGLVMGWPVPGEAGAPRERLLRPRDLVRELPLRGLLIAGGVLVLLVVVARSGAVGWLRSTVPDLLPRVDSPFLTALSLVLITIFATEVLNNTTVSTVMFPITAVAAPQFGADPLVAMLGVSLASTCAFMTPVATPVNALALTSIGRISLRRFLWTGLWVNLVAALWIALWITWLIPPVLRLFAS